ncbi:hypothetical protein ACLOJK_008322 [Asimina triloba]
MENHGFADFVDLNKSLQKRALLLHVCHKKVHATNEIWSLRCNKKRNQMLAYLLALMQLMKCTSIYSTSSLKIYKSKEKDISWREKERMKRSTDFERLRLLDYSSFLSTVENMPSGPVVVAYFPDIQMIVNKREAHEHEARNHAENVAEKMQTAKQVLVYHQNKDEDANCAAEGYIKRMHDTHKPGASRNDTRSTVAEGKKKAKQGGFMHNHSEKEDINLAAGEYIRKKHEILELQT